MNRALFEKLDVLGLRRLAATSHLAALLLLSGCMPAAARASITARREFARERYCPLHRVATESVHDVLPPPAARIARDPERIAMWRAYHPDRGKRMKVLVRGCDEEAAYDCDMVATSEVWEGLGRRTIHRGTVCTSLTPPPP